MSGMTGRWDGTGRGGWLALVLLAGVLASAGARADDPRPLAKARVGDWARYAMVLRVNGKVMQEATRTDRVVAKTDRDITLEATVNEAGKETKNRLTLKLDEEYMPTDRFELPLPGAKTRFKALGKGRETLHVAGHHLQTSWTLYDITIIFAGESHMRSRLWRSDAVPVGGMVRLQTESVEGAPMAMKQTVTLTGFGRGAK